jgi:enoyl-[acyl-carrier-protein] reductase (NADH)
VRGGPVLTESLRAIFGKDFEVFADRFDMRRHILEPGEISSAILALCSGLLDGVNGQVLTVDRGMTFSQTLSSQI